MSKPITLTQAVDMLYRGRSNLIKAAKAAETDPQTLKRLLLEKVRSKPSFEPLQLTLDLR